MKLFLDVLLALLAAAGLLALGWVLFGRLISPVGGAGPLYAVIPARGDGERLERDVRGVFWLRGGDLVRFTVIIADGGLTPAGQKVAEGLLAQFPGLVLCPLEQIPRYIEP